MTVYRYDKRVKLYRRSRPKTLLITLVLLIAIGVAVYFLLNRSTGGDAVTGNAVRLTNDPLQTFTTDYFTFTASKSWAEARDLSNFTDTFSYRKIVSASPVGTITIQVNNGHRDLITNLVQVDVDTGKIKDVGSVGEHCSNFVPDGSNLDPHDVTVEGVDFRCWTDSTLFIAAVGAEGLGLEVPLLRPNGETAKYAISYQSTSFHTDNNAILEVIENFETR